MNRSPRERSLDVVLQSGCGGVDWANFEELVFYYYQMVQRNKGSYSPSYFYEAVRPPE